MSAFSQLIIILSTFCLNGFVAVMLGSILPDLQCLLNVRLDEISYLFLGYSLTNIPGMAASGYIIKRCHPYLILLLLQLVQSIVISLMPLSRNIYLVAACLFVFGITTSVTSCTALHLTHVKWPGSTRMNYIVMAAFSFGSFTCPLLLQPFLSDGVVTLAYKEYINHTNKPMNIKLTLSERSIKTRFLNTDHSNCEEFTTLFQYPCLFIGLLGLPVSIGDFIFYTKTKTDSFTIAYNALSDENKMMQPSWFHLILIIVFFLPSLPMTFAGLLTTYGTRRLLLSLRTSNMMTSLMWTAFLLGRVLPAFLPEGFSQTKVIAASVFANFIGTGLLFGTRFSGEAMLWISSLFIGLSTGPILSGGITWFSQSIRMTPNIKAFCLSAMASGYLFPYICGLLMDMYGQDVFVYFHMAFGFYLLIIFIFLNIVMVGAKRNAV